MNGIKLVYIAVALPLLQACPDGDNDEVVKEPDKNYKIVYRSPTADFSQYYLFDHNNRLLTEASEYYSKYMLSADGNKMVFLSDVESGSSELFYIDLKSINVVPIKLSREALNDVSLGIHNFQLLSDNSGVVYWGDPVVDNAFNIYHVDFATPGVRDKISLNSAGDTIYDVSISPDNKWVAFTTDSEIDDVPEAYVARINGEDRHKINGSIGSGPSVVIPNVEWSSDGRYIIQEVRDYIGGYYDTDTLRINIHDFELGSPNSTQATEDLILDNNDFARTSLMVGDGSTLYRHSNNINTKRASLYQVQLDSSRIATLVGGTMPDYTFVRDYVYSPDKESIYYKADIDFDNFTDLYVSYSTSPSLRTKVNPDLIADRGVYAFQVSPDNSKIVYVADQDVNDVQELYLVDSANPGISTKLNQPLISGQDIQTDIRFTSDSRSVVYRVDMETEHKYSLFVVDIDNPGQPTKISKDNTNVISFDLR
jgi:Tol biopolymer transport system component